MGDTNYKLRYLPLFYRDLEGKIAYIAETLQNPQAANDLLDDDMIFAVKFRHNLPDHGGCQFQFRLFFLPHTITKRNGKMRYFIPIPDRYAEHDSHKAVSIQIVGIVVCGSV